MREKIKLNIKPILGSLLFALILWMMVATEKTYSYQIVVPIEIKRLAKGQTLLEPVPQFAIIEVQGKGRALIGAWFYDVAFRLELPNITKSQNIKLKDYLTFLDLPTTFGLSVLEIIEPSNIELKIDKEVTREIPIQLVGVIQPEDGYTLIDYRFIADSAVIRGPRSKVDKISSILTESIEFMGHTSSFEERTNLINPEPGIFSLSPRSVIIDIDIQRLVERIVREIPIKIQRVPKDLEVIAIPPKLALKVKGGERLVAALDTSSIKAEFDFMQNYQQDREKYAVSIITPEKISWIESFPKMFSLQIKKK